MCGIPVPHVKYPGSVKGNFQIWRIYADAKVHH